MVVVNCMLTCQIRRCNPSDPAAQHQAVMDQLIRDIASPINAQITNITAGSRAALKPYEDQLIIRIYDLTFNNISHDLASENLIETFYAFSRSHQQRHLYSFYMEIQPVAMMELPDFSKISVKNFQLGFMSSAVDFHSKFDYEQTFPLADKHSFLFFEHEKLSVSFRIQNDEPSDELLELLEDFNDDHWAFIQAILGDLVHYLKIGYNNMSPYLLVHGGTNSVHLAFIMDSPMELYKVSGRGIQQRVSSLRTQAFSTETLGGCNALLLTFNNDQQVLDVIEMSRLWYDFSVQHTALNLHDTDRCSNEAPFVPEPIGNDDINWMLAAIHCIGFRVRHQIGDSDIGGQFMRSVKNFLRGDSDSRRHLHTALCRTYDVLFSDKDLFLQIDRVLDYFLSRAKELEELVTSHSRIVRRLAITPSRIVLQTPCLMHDNRILRQFDPNSAVSARFLNDDMSDFFSNNPNFVADVIGTALRNGITVAGRHYEFLGCSGSQMKNRGCWLYAKDRNGKTTDDIRAWIGDLKNIRHPGKYLSRMGQCFSDTTAAEVDWSTEINWHEPDIEGGADPNGTPYCFSDGVGRISEECVKMVFAKLSDRVLPSAFQVRLGGAKGMLTVDTQLTGNKICVRESMVKFMSGQTTIEVMRRTQPVPLFLGNQIITLLSQHENGIKDHVFIRFFNQMMHRLADLLLDDRKALITLSESGLSCCFSELFAARFNFTTDPFFKGVLKAIVGARINKVKLKTRIEIPPEYGRNMLGVMDEVGVLEYGQVFIQYSKDIRYSKLDPIIRKGTVVVSKMPALHPGDVRKLQAVDRPELHHLVDCIVFPQKGPRPHPNEMSGSDLDGDEYFVTWHPDLIFRGPNADPMDFLAVPTEGKTRPLRAEDLIEFLIGYINSDIVGVIANHHTALADWENIYSPDCLKLAKIFSHVIDYNKTGYLPPEVKNRSYPAPRVYPDFMGKVDHKPSYPSRRILGKLYRISRRLEQAITIIDKTDTDNINEGSNWAIDKRFLICGHEEFLEEAEDLYKIYDDFLDTEQRRYGIESEEELVSACVIKIKGMYSRSDEIFDVEKRLKERMNDIRTFIRKRFDQILDEKGFTNHQKNPAELKFASACYKYAYTKNRPYRSFPWVFHDLLVKILRRFPGPVPEPPHVMLTKSIDSLAMDRVKAYFFVNRISSPPNDGLARIYYVLFNWGEKSGYLPKNDNFDERNMINFKQFQSFLDQVMQNNDQLDGYEDTGPLLCALFRAIKSLNAADLRPKLPFLAVINVKRQILHIHHQLAREPRVDKMLAEKLTGSGRSRKIIFVGKDRWKEIDRQQKELQKKYREKFGVLVQFNKGKRGCGGRIHIKGDDDNVFNFEDFWLEGEVPASLDNDD